MNATTVIMLVTLLPAIVLCGLACWVYWTQPDQDRYMDDIDDWGAQ